MTNDVSNNSIGGNPFATQAMIGLNQLPSSTRSNGIQSQSQSRVIMQTADERREDQRRYDELQEQRNQEAARRIQNHAHEYVDSDDRRSNDDGLEPGTQELADNYVPWTGRNHYQPSTEQEPLSESPEPRYQGRDIRYYQGPSSNYIIDQTQDRASIASKSGFLNVNDVTGITRGGEVTVTHDQYNPGHQDYSQHRAGHPDNSQVLGLSQDLQSSCELSYFNPDFIGKQKSEMQHLQESAPYFNQQQYDER